MPVTYGTYTKQLKLLPLLLAADGSGVVTVRFGYVDSNDIFTAATESSIVVTAEQVSEILDSPPVAGLSRRDDLSLAIYTYLVTNGFIDAGTVS